MDDITWRDLLADPEGLWALRDGLVRCLRDQPDPEGRLAALATELDAIDDQDELAAIAIFLAQRGRERLDG